MAHVSWYTEDAASNTFVQNFSPLVLQPPVPGGELTLWNMVRKAVDGTNTDLEWIEEPNTPVTVTSLDGANGALDDQDSSTSLELASGEAANANIRTGSILWDSTSGKRETIYVSSISSDTLTIVRDYGGIFSANNNDTHVKNSTWEVVDTVNYEGSSVPSTKLTRDRAAKKNYYSIQDETTQVTGTDLARIYRGSTPDNWAYQVAGVVRQITRKMERTLLHGRSKARSSSDEGSMGGIIDLIEDRNSSTNINTTTENFTYEVWDDALKQLFTDNGEDAIDPVTIVPTSGLQVVPYIHESALRGDYQQTIRGMYARTLQSTVRARPVPVVGVAHFPKDAFAVIDRNALKVHFMRGRGLAMYVNNIGDNLKDKREARWISEMSLEFHNPDTRAYYHRNVTFDRTAV